MIVSRVGRVASGLDIGFVDAAFSAALREAIGGQWMTVVTDESARAAVAPDLPAGTVHRLGVGSALPFEDRQFNLVVLNGASLSVSLVREIHRVLRPDGLLFFQTEEFVRRGPSSTSARIYNSFLRAGFNVTDLIRPPWWKQFARDGRTLTVCATRKNWREQKGFSIDETSDDR